jgi:ketosteroid isomerase-like protein
MSAATERKILAIALLAAGLACRAPGAGPARLSAPPPAAALSTADRAAIADVLAAQAAAWNRGDLAGYMAGYLRSPDLVFTSGSKVRTGYDETYATYQQKYGTDRASMGTLAFKVMRVDAVGPGGAVVLGRWDLQRADGTAGGVFSVVLVRSAAGWVIMHDHTSVDTP